MNNLRTATPALTAVALLRLRACVMVGIILFGLLAGVILFGLLAGVILFGLLADTASACPTCKEALAGTEGGGDIVNGYFYSIMFMVSMPFTILGGFGVCVYRAVNKAKASGMYDEANYMPRSAQPTSDRPSE